MIEREIISRSIIVRVRRDTFMFSYAMLVMV